MKIEVCREGKINKGNQGGIVSILNCEHVKNVRGEVEPLPQTLGGPLPVPTTPPSWKCGEHSVGR